MSEPFAAAQPAVAAAGLLLLAIAIVAAAGVSCGIPAGVLVPALGTLFGFLGVTGVVSDATGGVRVLLAALLALATLSVWVRLATVYAGPVQSRRQ